MNNLQTIKFKEITNLILRCFFNVYNELGYGFLEKVYQNAMFIELGSFGCDVLRERPIRVIFKGNVVGEFFADFVVNRINIVELKAAECIVDSFHSQLLNYLKATDIEVGLLLNFGQKPQFIRKIFTNDRKQKLHTEYADETDFQGLFSGSLSHARRRRALTGRDLAENESKIRIFEAVKIILSGFRFPLGLCQGLLEMGQRSRKLRSVNISEISDYPWASFSLFMRMMERRMARARKMESIAVM